MFFLLLVWFSQLVNGLQRPLPVNRLTTKGETDSHPINTRSWAFTAACCYLIGLAEHGKGAGLLANSLLAGFVITPDVAVVEPFRPKVATVQRLAGADVISKFFDQILQRSAVTEPPPPTTPDRFMGEDPLAGVVVDKPDLAAGVDFHAGVAIDRLAVEEPAPVVSDDTDRQIDLLGALLLQGEFVFCGHEASFAGSCPGGGGGESSATVQ